MGLHICFDKIKVETMEDNAGIFIGRNFSSGRSSYSKTQEGISSIKGNNNVVDAGILLIFDDDYIDFAVKPKKKY